MDFYEINGKKYNFLFSLKAIKDYQDRILKAKEDEGSNSVDEVYEWARLGFKYGGNPVDPEVLADWMDNDFEAAIKLGNLCRNKIKRFHEALTGNQMQDNVEAKKK